MRSHAVIGTIFTLTTALLGTSPAPAADLTGVWLGEQRCERFDGRAFSTRFADDVMVISQQGDEIRVAALLFGDTFQLLYQGRVIADERDPDRKAQAAFTECTTTPTSQYQETARATKIEVKPNGEGRFEATSIFFETDAEGAADMGTCSWKYKRADTVDLGVPSCAEVTTLQATGGQSRRRP
jgi:hypothetical protein